MILKNTIAKKGKKKKKNYNEKKCVIKWIVNNRHYKHFPNKAAGYIRSSL